MRSETTRTASFTQQARRVQIIEVTVRTLATDGYVNTSLSKIAANAGFAKGVTSYHFPGKDALMVAVMQHVYAGITERVLPQVVGLSPLERVSAHVLAVARDVRDHPDEVRAATEIATHLRDDAGGYRFGVHTNEGLYAALEQNYREGQAIGEMRSFDIRAMAVWLQAGLDSMFEYCRVHPDRDLLAHAEAFADLVRHAIQAPATLPAHPTPTATASEEDR